MIYILLLTTLCMGCGGSLSMRQLEQLEARMNDAPDSVLAVLTATDMPRWGEARALYALLTVQAQDKSYIDVTNDSLITVATDYYQRKGQPLRRLQAFYYHGLVYQRCDSVYKALHYYTRAKDFTPKVDAPYPIGLLNTQMGVLYGNVYDFPHGLVCMESALKNFEQAGEERLQYIAKRNIGQFHLNMEHTKQADSILNEVLTWSEIHKESRIKYSTLSLLLRLYDATENIKALDSLITNYPLRMFGQNATTYGIIAHYHALKGDEIAARNALDQAKKVCSSGNDAGTIWYKGYKINKILGNADIALGYYEKLYDFQDSVARVTLQQPLMASQRDYYHSEFELVKARNLNLRYLVGVIILVSFFLATLLFILVSYKDSRKQC